MNILARSNHFGFMKSVFNKSNSIRMDNVPIDLLKLLVAIEHSIKECRSYNDLQNVRNSWLNRLDREYGSNKSKTCQSLIRETWDIWSDRVTEIETAIRNQVIRQQKFN